MRATPRNPAAAAGDSKAARTDAATALGALLSIGRAGPTPASHRSGARTRMDSMCERLAAPLPVTSARASCACGLHESAGTGGQMSATSTKRRHTRAAAVSRARFRAARASRALLHTSKHSRPSDSISWPEDSHRWSVASGAPPSNYKFRFSAENGLQFSSYMLNQDG
jgi:hypothetical protein